MSPVFALTEIASNPPRVMDPEYPGWFIYNHNPGDTIIDAVVFTNTAPTRQRARVYVSDYIETGNEGFGVKNIDHTQTTLGAWATLSQTELIIEPHKNVVVELKIDIPSDATKMRTAGGVMIEMLDPDTGERETTLNSEGVIFSYRSGSRIYIFPDGTDWDDEIYFDPVNPDDNESE